MARHKTKRLKVGDRVLIYHDPITQTNQEGEAYVRRIHSRVAACDEAYYDVTVEFLAEMGVRYRRQLYRRV